MLLFKRIIKRILNFANENIDFLAIVHNIKEAIFQICCYKIYE